MLDQAAGHRDGRVRAGVGRVVAGQRSLPKVGVMGSLGVRQDLASVPALAALLGAGDGKSD